MFSAYQLITTAVPFDCAGTCKEDVSLELALTDVFEKATGLPPSKVYVTTKVADISDAVLFSVIFTGLLVPLQLPSAAVTVGLKSNVGSPT